MIRKLALLGLVTAATLVAGPLTVVAPKQVQLAERPLLELRRDLDGLVKEGVLPGAAVLVARRGKVAFVHTTGERAPGAPMQRDTIFRIYSMSKTVTSVAALMLWEEGKLDLDAPVARYIPELADLVVAVGESGVESPDRQPTVRDLFLHTSGFTYGIFGQTRVDKEYRAAGLLNPLEPMSRFVEKLGKLPLLNQPGERWHYSVSIDVLGHVVERISGQGLDAFFAERIFGPLNMVDTGFWVPTEKLSRLSAAYTPTPEGLTAKELPASSPFQFQPPMLGGGGGLVSTLDDYARFALMILGRGTLDGARLLRPETVDSMLTNQLPPALASRSIAPGVGFGFGGAVRMTFDPNAPNHPVREFGWGGLAGTTFFVAPDQELVGVCMQQVAPHGQTLDETVRRAVLRAVVY
ncbi:MAG: beta-lactamase family protein [Planctomycetes bacterium]|nr:beta-lactamase family protein [Planctomycetota bacterium]